MKGDDGEKEHDETRLNVTLERGQLLNILQNQETSNGTLEQRKVLFYSRNEALELSRVGVSVKSINRFPKDVTIWEGELREPLRGCQTLRCP